MEKTFVTYRGSRMIEGWPEKIQEAQSITHVTCGDRDFARIRYGSETNGWTAEKPCHDCCVIAGEYHVPGCDVEQCPSCEGQLIGCDCEVGDTEDEA